MPDAGKHRLEPRSLPARRGDLPLAGRPDVVGGVGKWEGVQVDVLPPEASGLRTLAFYECDLIGLSLAGKRAELRLIDCNACSLDLANASLDLEVVRSSIRESRLVGAALAGSVRDAAFDECLFDLASLRACKLSRSEFHGCSLIEADAYAAELRSVLLAGCDLTGADFSAAICERSEFRGCDLTALRGVESLRGVQIPLADLLPITPLLASALGIIPTD